jgi:hypothetical protein
MLFNEGHWILWDAPDDDDDYDDVKRKGKVVPVL